MVYKAEGKIIVEKDALRVVFCRDFCEYYKYLILKDYWNTIRLQTPKHGGHITILNSRIHGFFNFKAMLLKYRGKTAEFEYDITNIKLGGGSKGFMNFYMPVKCWRGDQIKKECGIKDSRNWLGYHITLVNNKKMT